MFIRAERTGNWHEHLGAMRVMLNLFAATGHKNYAESARLYLQSMQHLIQNRHGFLSSIVNHVNIVSDAPIATGQTFGPIW